MSSGNTDTSIVFPSSFSALYFFLEWLSAGISRARLNRDGGNGALLFCFLRVSS